MQVVLAGRMVGAMVIRPAAVLVSSLVLVLVNPVVGVASHWHEWLITKRGVA